ncbi:MAG: methionine aminotransferase [Saprospiraceae bacterium]
MQIQSKLPKVGSSIFSVMSAMARDYQAINLSQGFPNFDGSDKLKQLVNKHIKAGKNQYAPMAGVPELREQIARKFQNLYNVEVDANTEITVTAGATQAIFTVIAAFIRPGDEVIMIEPAYDSYRPSVELNGGRPVTYELSGPDYKVDWNHLQKLVSFKTKMIIINTPQNPIGKTLKLEDYQALEKITDGTDILILSDEVYEHLVFDGFEHHSILKFPKLRERSLATFSFGKTYHHTGWKLGYCVAPPNLMAEFQKVHQFNVFCVNTPMQYALADFMEFPEEYLNLPAFYQKKRDFLLEAVKGTSLRPIKCEGTYFQLFDYSAVSQDNDMEFAKWLIQEHGVATVPVSAFYSSRKNEHVIRVCFAKTEETLAQAAAILKKI